MTTRNLTRTAATIAALSFLAAAAKGIEAALDRTLADPMKRTADLGDAMGTREFALAVAAALG